MTLGAEPFPTRESLRSAHTQDGDRYGLQAFGWGSAAHTNAAPPGQTSGLTPHGLRHSVAGIAAECPLEAVSTDAGMPLDVFQVISS
jgi:hypothetical protein